MEENAVQQVDVPPPTGPPKFSCPFFFCNIVRDSQQGIVDHLRAPESYNIHAAAIDNMREFYCETVNLYLRYEKCDFIILGIRRSTIGELRDSCIRNFETLRFVEKMWACYDQYPPINTFTHLHYRVAFAHLIKHVHFKITNAMAKNK